MRNRWIIIEDEEEVKLDMEEQVPAATRPKANNGFRRFSLFFFSISRNLVWLSFSLHSSENFMGVPFVFKRSSFTSKDVAVRPASVPFNLKLVKREILIDDAILPGGGNFSNNCPGIQLFVLPGGKKSFPFHFFSSFFKYR